MSNQSQDLGSQGGTPRPIDPQRVRVGDLSDLEFKRIFRHVVVDTASLSRGVNLRALGVIHPRHDDIFLVNMRRLVSLLPQPQQQRVVDMLAHGVNFFSIMLARRGRLGAAGEIHNSRDMETRWH
jgi:hypothetical protein